MTGISNRFNRIIAIFIQLQSGKVIKARELADRFEVSLRTIYRDIKSLEIAGVPILGEAGQGYSLMEGYRLPPVMFSAEEAGSFVTAQKLVQKYTDKSIIAHFNAAMYKVKSVLNSSSKDRVNILEELVQIYHTGKNGNGSESTLEILLESISEKFQVKLAYKKPGSEEVSERFIEPAGLFNEHNHWYIVAYCHLRKEYRQFRTDRIELIQRTSRAFTKTHNYELEIARIKTPETTNEEIIIKIERKALPYILNSREYFGYKEEELTHTHSIMRFLTNLNCDSMARWVLTFADKAEIVSPDSLKQQVHELVQKIKKNLLINPAEAVGS